MELKGYLNKKIINKLQVNLKKESTIYTYIKIKRILIIILTNIDLLILLISKELVKKIKLKISSNDKIKV